MDPLGAAASFATIVGLLADFTSQRSSRQGSAEFADFAEWLRFHGHTETLAAIQANHATTISIKAALAEGQKQLLQRFAAIERELASVSDRQGPFGHLARSLYPAIPNDLLEHLTPGAPRERVQQILGMAHRVATADVWFYRCPEALVQVEFYPNSGARSIAIALTNQSPPSGFKVPWLEKPLGVLTFEDVINRKDGEIRYRSSLRTQEVLYETRVGPTGAWTNLTLGALCPLAPGTLAETEFEWDAEKQTLRSNPVNVLVNWVATSMSDEEMWFDWSVALP